MDKKNIEKVKRQHGFQLSDSMGFGWWNLNGMYPDPIMGSALGMASLDHDWGEFIQ